MRFDDHHRSASVRELADALGMSLPTTHRYVALLRELGFLEESERSGHYQLGWRILQLAQTAQASSGLVQMARPIMVDLSSASAETVTLLRLVDDRMECIAQVEGTQMLRLSLMTGQRLPLTAGASARALLSQLRSGDRERLLDRLAAEDRGFALRRPSFEADLDVVSEQGWFACFEEIDPGVWAVAAPLKTNGESATCLSVAGPVSRFDVATRDRIVTLTLGAAASIEAALAARTDPSSALRA